MKRRNQRGEAITATLVLAMYVAGLFGWAGRQWALENQTDQIAGDRGSIIRIGIDYSGRTKSVCEER